jgi:CBS domain-containing protein
LTVKPDESVHMVLLIMADGNVSRVVVDDNNGKPVGIITSHDLLPASTLQLQINQEHHIHKSNIG